ncbi:Uncharacterised protein [Bacillus cereus]|nr:Uncharacterised protein [Bacillus cereus]
MGGNSHYNYITMEEPIFIHFYVTGEEIPSSQALQILKQFAPEEILGINRQTDKRVGIIYGKMEKNCSDTIGRNIERYMIIPLI